MCFITVPVLIPNFNQMITIHLSTLKSLPIFTGQIDLGIQHMISERTDEIG